MKDLANERDLARRKLEEFNFEPVNAENMLPDGAGSWQRVAEEIAYSDLLVLILGETYGWIPTSGPHGGSGLSVTELEFLEAQRLGLPVLPFVKRLDAPSGSPDAERREAFRRRVEDWDHGRFRAHFDLAHDLADKVARSLVAFLGNHYLQEALRRRREYEPQAPDVTDEMSLTPPAAMVDAVQARSAVVLIGAGVSLQAGLPSAPLFIEAMRERIERFDPAYRPSTSGSLFFAVASDLEALLGLAELQRVVQELVSPPFLTGTTESHRNALRLFDLVVTTNYDELLERALPEVGTRAVVADDQTLVDLSHEPAIVKLHGSVGRPESLVITEPQLAALTTSHVLMREALIEQLCRRPLITVGSSLRDSGLVALLEAARPNVHGWAVADRVPLADRHRIKRWNLEPLEADAHALFATLTRAVRGAPR